MSSVFSDQMEQDYYDERFMQDVAKRIDTELLEEMEAAQTQDIDEEWLTDLKRRSIRTIRFKKYLKGVLTVTKRVGRIAAIFFLTFCLLFSSIYLTVDAARETINNFFLGKTNSRNAIVLPIYLHEEDYVLIPIDWTCPIYPTWIPDEYHLAASGTELDRYWWLAYHPKGTIKQSICIYIWDDTFTPSIDIESYEIVAENTVQGVPATIYYDSKHDFHSLIMVKDDWTIQIIGNIDYVDIVEIAEKMVF